ncbi:MAG TPA: hypothetical protein DEP12_02905 [Planctomycetaceae bacterium]|nr:hypothetical protein [Planctomycetaceae bacterium]
MDDTELKGVEGLRDYLTQQRKDDFLRQFCKKLLGYALGREVQLSDKPLIDEMIQGLKENQYQVNDAIIRIVTSKQFRYIRGRDLIVQD